MRKGKRVLTMRWFLLSLALMVGTAHSLGPQPKQGEQNTNQSKADAANNPVIVEAPSPQSDEEKTTKEHSDARIAVATENLVLVTFVLAVFTGLLFGATVLLARDAKKTGDRQAIEVQRSLDLTQESINLARKEFLASHRPRVIVRRVSHVIRGVDHAVEYIIANTGDTAATIVELSASLRYKEAVGILTWNPAIPSYADSIPKSIRIECGTTIPQIHEENAKEFFTAVEARSAPEPVSAPTIVGSDLLFLGYIVYQDDIGTKRTTAFCRAYKRSAKRFAPIDDRDYEYQD